MILSQKQTQQQVLSPAMQQSLHILQMPLSALQEHLNDISIENPEFSGFARYETSIVFSGEGTVTLEITDADEGVEVFVNGRSLGIEIAPPMRYDLSSHLIQGENLLAIEVATTLERQAFPLLDDYGKKVTCPPSGKTGLTGTVRLYR